MIIDTHSHLQFKAYDADREEVIQRTKKEGILCIAVGTKYETSQNAILLAEKYEGIYAAIGLHPIHIKTDLMKLRTDEDEGAFAPLGEVFDKEKYRQLAKNKKVVAIGEVGLDYYYRPKSKAKLAQFKQNQKEIFLAQVDLAEELNLPLIIHCRMAHKDVLEILKTKKMRGVVHCFTGGWDEAQQYISLGFYIGMNGIMDKLDLKEVVEKTPLEKIVVETDCPYLTPKAEEGKRNEPIFVKHVIQKIAELKGLSFNEIVSATTQNAKNVFGM